MKKITLIIALTLCLMLILKGSYGQSITLGINDIDVTSLNPGDKVYISLTVDAVTPGSQIWGLELYFNVAAGYLQWDGTGANPMPGVTYVNPLFPPVILPNYVSNWYLHSDGVTNVFSFYWGDGGSFVSLNGQSFPVTILTLQFTYLGGILPGQTIPITWSTSNKSEIEPKVGGFTAAYYNDWFELFPNTNLNSGSLFASSGPTSTLNLKMFLEGPYFNSLMTPWLNLFGYIPLSQPYNTPPWNYNGAENVAEIPNGNVVDWVLVQLLSRHSGSVEYMFQVEAQKAAFLLKNGDIKALDGISSLVFNNIDASNLYLRIYHRNHMPLISPAPLTGTNNAYNYNFTTGPDKNIGGSIVQKQLTAGLWGTKAADGDANKQIDNKDKDELWLLEKELDGYYNGDFNMNSQVDSDDKITKWNPNAGTGFPPVKDTITINQPPAVPSNPQPIDSAADQPINTTLSWTCTDPDNDPMTYDVYFGTTNPPVIAVSGQTEINYNPGALNYNTQYFWKIVAYDDHSNTAEGPVWNFTTIVSGTWQCGNALIDSRDNQTYNTVQIGTQCWMAENLNIGARIDGTAEQTDNSILEKYCYDNLETNCDTYGGLYQWNEMMQYLTTEGAQGICPTGWHLPTDGEWCTLTTFIDPTVNCNFQGFTGTDLGTKMKAINGWFEGGNGTNTSGFTGIPGGYRLGDGSFSGMQLYTNIWSATENNPGSAWYWVLNWNRADIGHNPYDESSGFSIRCTKDTPPTWSCGDVLNDTRDNQTYNTVQIGDQCWMAENLNIGTRVDGIVEQTNNSTIEKYCYDNLETNCDTYGGLYQWNEMMQYVTTEGVQGICPTGWHLPTNTEYTNLTDYLGGEYIAGGKMKTIGTIEEGTGLWWAPNTGATNESGFSAIPGGRYADGGFGYISGYPYFWSSTESNTEHAWFRQLAYLTTTVYYDDGPYKSYGFSVRCIKDTPPNWSCGDVLNDTRDNQTYNTVQIGDQCWMAENLNIGTRIDGIAEQTNNSTIEKYCYDNLETNCDTYGGLYQWNEMMQYVTTEGVQGICPIGWHLPTDGEWCTTTQFIDATVDCYINGFSGTDVGTKMKYTSGWIEGGNGTNISGFGGLSGGWRHPTSFFLSKGFLVYSGLLRRKMKHIQSIENFIIIKLR